jgi:hypothetical protein
MLILKASGSADPGIKGDVSLSPGEAPDKSPELIPAVRPAAESTDFEIKFLLVVVI